MTSASPVAHWLKLTFKQGIPITDDNLAATQTSEPPAGSDIATHHKPTAGTESMQELSVGTDTLCGGFISKITVHALLLPACGPSPFPALPDPSKDAFLSASGQLLNLSGLSKLLSLIPSHTRVE